ncbi:acyl carrier protein [Luteibacter sp.]|jgi:acyl carrier protein|uniref:acyl carrier protein n=1 Tax=Luteibacter sp. TaxID=1886636 RepID=UPI003F7CE27E
MTHQNIVAQVIELITQLPDMRSPAHITEKTGLTGDLGLDSLKVMDLVVLVEDHFDISVPVNELADIKTVGEFATLIGKIVDKHA